MWDQWMTESNASVQEARARHLRHALNNLVSTLSDDELNEDQREAATYAYLTLRQDAATFKDDP